MISPSASPYENMVSIPGGTFTMGSDHDYPEEAPAHRVTVSEFWMDQYAVTNAQFHDFVNATGYATVAERQPDPEVYPNAAPELLVPGSLAFQQPERPVDLRNSHQWWAYVPGVSWRHPQGPDHTVEGLEDHPVTHIAFEDAEAFAAWAGKSLPSEAQWEFAARGGLEGAPFVWGDTFAPDDEPMANTWEGEFPWQNLKPQPPGTMVVGSFSANGYGLYDMAGNVWEWTTDWFQPRHADAGEGCTCTPSDPRGPDEGQPDPAAPRIRMRVVKGGSFLCAHNYCKRYRPAARSPEAVDTSTGHIGFRCIVGPEQDS